tara:strand:- start:7715 stop:8419 length:705 start_codon:yes stop_codon:yes gene_type:complete
MFSQFGQDKYVIENIFKGKKNGFYIDVGAHDGVFISNTNLLEKKFKWKGVCIEPSSSSSMLKLNRDEDCKIVSNYCVCDNEVSNQIVRLREFFPNEISETIFKDLYEEPHWAKELEKGENYKDKLKKCKTLDEILEESSCPENIDYISIDTQGCELLVVKDFPFKKWNVKAFTIANDMYQGGEKEKNRNKTKKLLEKNGYVLDRSFSLHHLDKNNWENNYKDQILEDLYIKQDN